LIPSRRGLVKKMSVKEINERVETLEKNMSQMLKMLEKILSTVEKETQEKREGEIQIRQDTEPPLPVSSVLGVHAEKINPWTYNAALRLMNKEIEKKFIEDSLSSYIKTIKVLFEVQEPMTAGEIAKKTGRERNTESGYLNKLLRAGLVNRNREKSKVYFSLGDLQEIEQVIGPVR